MVARYSREQDDTNSLEHFAATKKSFILPDWYYHFGSPITGRVPERSEMERDWAPLR